MAISRIQASPKKFAIGCSTKKPMPGKIPMKITKNKIEIDHFTGSSFEFVNGSFQAKGDRTCGGDLHDRPPIFIENSRRGDGFLVKVCLLV